MFRLSRRLNITQIFFLFLLLTSVLPVLALGTTSYSITQKTLKEQATDRAEQVVRERREYLDLQMGKIEDLVIGISGMQPLLQWLDQEENHRAAFNPEVTQVRIESILNSFNRSEDVVSIEIFSRSGSHYHTGPSPFDSPGGEALAAKICDEAAVSGQEVYWTGVLDASPNDNIPQIQAAVRRLEIVDEETGLSKPAGFVMVLVNSYTLYQPFASTSLGRGGYMVVVDSHNRLVYHPDPAQLDELADSTLIVQLKDDAGGFTYLINGEQYLINYNRTRVDDWLVISLLPVNTLLEPANTINMITTVIILASFGIVAVAAMVINDNLVRPLREISNRVQRLQQGGLPDDENDLVEYQGKNELSELVRWFNLFVAGLKEKHQAEEALRRSEETFRSLVENSDDWFWQLDGDMVFTYTSAKVKQLLGYEVEDMIGRSVLDMLLPESVALRDMLTRAFQSPQRITGVEVPIHHRNGSLRVFEANASPMYDTQGNFTGFSGICHDITRRKQTEEALRESEDRYALAVRGTNDGIWDWDLQSNVVYYSQRWKSMLGYEDDEVGDQLSEWLGRIHPDDVDEVRTALNAHLDGISPRFEAEYRIFHKSGRYRWMQSVGLAVRNENLRPTRIAGSQTDISARKATEERLRHDAMHDPLTNLPNRMYFLDQVKRSIDRTHRYPGYLAAVLFMDLDRFKIVNDSLGHVSGDLMLVAIAQRLERCLRSEDTIARFGGDEFAILLDNINSVNDAIWIANRVQKEVSRPVMLQGHEVFTTVSIGIALSNLQYQRPEDLLRDADTAMYRAKSSGRARYQVFDQEMHAMSLSLLQLEGELRRAVDRNEFKIYYQPVISLRTGSITSVEALIRWQHPQHGLILPGRFMELAEETGLTSSIGEMVLREACREIRSIRATGYPYLQLAVNISSRHFQEPGFADLVRSILASEGLPGQALTLEITENAAMQDFETTRAVIRELQEIGVQLAIDDFGTSYSSLGNLKRFSVSAIKIDQSFIQDVTTSADNAAITTAIIAIGHILNLQVIAEGVETMDQLKFLLAQGCDHVQGFLFDRGMPFSELMDHLKNGYQIYPLQGELNLDATAGGEEGETEPEATEGI